MIFADSDSCKKGRKEEDLFVNYICGSGAADVLHADAVFLLFLVDHHDFFRKPKENVIFQQIC
jgi:hypothetical protein